MPGAHNCAGRELPNGAVWRVCSGSPAILQRPAYFRCGLYDPLQVTGSQRRSAMHHRRIMKPFDNAAVARAFVLGITLPSRRPHSGLGFAVPDPPSLRTARIRDPDIVSARASLCSKGGVGGLHRRHALVPACAKFVFCGSQLPIRRTRRRHRGCSGTNRSP